jgi:hypothetical protein
MTQVRDKNIVDVDWSKVLNKPTILTQTDLTNATAGLVQDMGSYNASTNVFPSTGGSGAAGAILKGDMWTISVAGTLGGSAVEVGDTVRALVDSPGTTAGNWTIQQGNITTTVRIPAHQRFTPTASQTSFTLTNAPAIGFPVNVWVNSCHQTNQGATPDFTVSGSTLTWSNANSGITLGTTDVFVIEYWY